MLVELLYISATKSNAFYKLNNLDSMNFRAIYRANWKYSQSDFCKLYQIDSRNFSSFISGKKISDHKCEIALNAFKDTLLML
jgi:hypothetical protein